MNGRAMWAALTLSVGLCLLSGTAIAHGGTHSTDAPHAVVAEVASQALQDYPGKEITLITVDYPPGAVDPVHRHDAHAIVYVLDGTIIMGVRGKPEQTIKAGETFYEGPNDVHTVGRNASKTKPAKFVVFLLKDKEKPLLIPAE
jgi:quercetin dioxygenase-like cupin family protein